MEKPSIWTVTQVTRYLKSLFDTEEELQNCWIRGEISNFKRHSSGHMYLTLKDSESRLKAVMFKSANRSLAFLPEDGMKVIARGYISIFERDGQYQLYIEEMQPDGMGALYLAFQQLKERLEREGLFAAERKRPLPLFPRTIGVITSPTGAAVRDIITTLRRRYPLVNILLCPVTVQGDGSASAIVEAIEKMNADREVDLLIVGRGGGSLEELWAFNEESVARAIAASSLPVISAVGHETDVTIADFVADVRAATPTAAAELAVPHAGELMRHIYQLEERLGNALRSELREAKQRLARSEHSRFFTRPKQALEQWRQTVDALENELTLRMQHILSLRSQRWLSLTGRLRALSPSVRLSDGKRQWQYAGERLEKAARRHWEKTNLRFERLLDQMNAYNPLMVMKRGFALVYKQEGKKQKLVRHLHEIQLGDMVQVRLQDGRMDCQVWGLEDSHESGNGT